MFVIDLKSLVKAMPEKSLEEYAFHFSQMERICEENGWNPEEMWQSAMRMYEVNNLAEFN